MNWELLVVVGLGIIGAAYPKIAPLAKKLIAMIQNLGKGDESPDPPVAPAPPVPEPPILLPDEENEKSAEYRTIREKMDLFVDLRQALSGNPQLVAHMDQMLPKLLVEVEEESA